MVGSWNCFAKRRAQGAKKMMIHSRAGTFRRGSVQHDSLHKPRRERRRSGKRDAIKVTPGGNQRLAAGLAKGGDTKLLHSTTN